MFFQRRIAIFLPILPFVVLSLWADGLVVKPASGIDLGEFAAESNQTACFTLQNNSTNSITIGKVESCCATLEPVVYERRIAPGQDIPLDVLLEGGSQIGPFSKQVKIFTTDSDKPQILQIKGNARPAIMPDSAQLFTGWTPLNEQWSTNLTVKIRDGLNGPLKVMVQANATLTASATPLGDGRHRITLTLPPQTSARSWQGTLLLRLENQPLPRPVMIPLSGCFGGSLHIVPQTVKLKHSGRQTVELTLSRRSPAGSATPAPLRCSRPQIRITEHPGKADAVRLTLHLPADFVDKLEKGKRYPIELTAEGYVPATLILEP